jgi:hypothetical protein
MMDNRGKRLKIHFDIPITGFHLSGPGARITTCRVMRGRLPLQMDFSF